jgi:CheY-like chemotaxis protein
MENINHCQSILVVEDDDDIRNLLVEALEAEGYKAEAAVNGKDALDKLGVIPKPCLVLLDMMMPIMNGREFLDTIMQDAYLAPIPVLVVSAVADRTDTKGSVGFLKKPIDLDIILNVVANFCH